MELLISRFLTGGDPRGYNISNFIRSRFQDSHRYRLFNQLLFTSSTLSYRPRSRGFAHLSLSPFSLSIQLPFVARFN